jgi:hypothetical protein
VAVGDGLALGDGLAVGARLGVGVGNGVGATVGEALGCGVRDAAAVAVGEALGVAAGVAEGPPCGVALLDGTGVAVGIGATGPAPLPLHATESSAMKTDAKPRRAPRKNFTKILLFRYAVKSGLLRSPKRKDLGWAWVVERDGHCAVHVEAAAAFMRVVDVVGRGAQQLLHLTR